MPPQEMLKLLKLATGAARQCRKSRSQAFTREVEIIRHWSSQDARGFETRRPLHFPNIPASVLAPALRTAAPVVAEQNLYPHIADKLGAFAG